jgi:hypothetical protein
VVAGARKLIERHRPVITTELSEAMLEEVSGTTPSEYLNYFHGLGYSLAVIDRATGVPKRYPTVRSLLIDWREHYQIEDLLLTPDASPPPVSSSVQLASERRRQLKDSRAEDGSLMPGMGGAPQTDDQNVV